MLALETLKTLLKMQKTQNSTIYARTCSMAPSRGLACLLPAACFLLSVEPSPGHTSFIQYHFQGNIQQFLLKLYFRREIILSKNIFKQNAKNMRK
jgi:hypothetical protein